LAFPWLILLSWYDAKTPVKKNVEKGDIRHYNAPIPPNRLFRIIQPFSDLPFYFHLADLMRVVRRRLCSLIGSPQIFY